MARGAKTICFVSQQPFLKNITFNVGSGDSYTTTGFQPDMAQPSPEFPLGNPAYPGATSSNGPNYIDFLTTTYNQTLVETYNLAYGGATVDSDIVPCYLPTVPDYRQQVNTEFMPYYVDENAANSDWTPQNSLFITFFGINDVTNSYSAQNTTINGDILTVYSGLVGQLYNAGARNFLFMNVPPVNLSPGTVMNGASAQALESADITNFNNQIAQVASTYSTYPDATVFLYDTNAMFSHVLKNPTSFQQTAGYVNTTTYCTAYANGTPAEDSFDPSCGVPVNQYFWLNTLHPTYPMHDVVAQTIVGQLEYGSCLGC